MQHFFESTFKKCDPLTDTFWTDRVSDKSLLGQEANKILGSDWKNILADTDTVPTINAKS